MIYSILIGIILLLSMALSLFLLAKGDRNYKYTHLQGNVRSICKYTGLRKLEDYEVTNYWSNEGSIGDIYVSIGLKIDEKIGKRLIESGKLPISIKDYAYIDINGSINTLDYRYMTT